MGTAIANTDTSRRESLRNVFAQKALAEIPKILTLGDRNPHSPTYGCFDRNYWQYKIIDFPSGMSQEFVWPLALAYSLDCPENPYFQEPKLKIWGAAGIRYAMESSHPDGSCDDYFPFERAGGAAAFSLLAFIETYELLGLNEPDLLEFMGRRADWLAHHQESGRLTNHQALIVLALERLGQLTGSRRWDGAKAKRLETVLSWQDSEGWFQEYEGCDPGYHTLTVSCLARIYAMGLERGAADPRLKEALVKAVDLAALFVHPDGSFGGEYTSRNTYNFFPHGFELVGRWYPAALAINDQVAAGLLAGQGACYADDHIVGHHVWNYLLTWQDFAGDRPPVPQPQPRRTWLPNARILIDKRWSELNDKPELVTLILALNKGGVYKIFRDNSLVASDTQFSLLVNDKKSGKTKNAVGHLVDDYDITVDDNHIGIQGKLGWAKQTQMTTAKSIILRVVMNIFGRFFPNLIRSLLQKILIVGKQETPFRFARQLKWDGEQWCISDDLQGGDWGSVKAIELGVDGTSIYVVMSRTFQRGQLQKALDLSDRLSTLAPNEPLHVERYF
ncbi:MAG: hypothetical protein AAF685_12740 [Cyanobacteria bacterium P01_C01_bin.89]